MFVIGLNYFAFSNEHSQVTRCFHADHTRNSTGYVQKGET